MKIMTIDGKVVLAAAVLAVCGRWVTPARAAEQRLADLA